MSEIIIALPDHLKDWVDRQTATGQFLDATTYVTQLIRRDQQRSAKITAMQAAVEAGLASGIGVRTADDLFEVARDQGRTVRGA